MPEVANYKRIIVCCDGTWMAANTGDASTPSNVAKIARAIAPHAVVDGKIVTQVVSYNAGLGSTSLPFAKAIEGGLGWGLDIEVTQVYDFISNNYELGDELFFLGFSRGAFTVRSAACLVSDVGILSAVNMGSFAEMWKAYRARSSKSPFEKSQWYRENGDRLKIKTVPVKVVGVWDTVGALGVPQWPGVTALQAVGIPLNQKYAFHDTSLPRNIQHGFQALALDEKRITFPPTMWHQTASKEQRLEQCWFPGVHSNVGGQADDPIENGDRGEIAANTLAWMIDNIGTMLTFEAEAIDLLISQHTTALVQNGDPSGWGCGKIVDNFAGLSGTFFRLLGRQTRTPGAYSDDAHEFIHPMVRYRRARVSSWKPAAVTELTLNDGNKTAVSWSKAGQNDVPEYPMFVERESSVAKRNEDGSWEHTTRSSLAKDLCPRDVFRWLYPSLQQE
ncbi:hypothetical protein CKM354_000017900 [Cercospora kikuchii]|uniref:T6SS Phospholipase effector Tle1-like catalytic domain-containing protein n=1 Tax=Cercospora kikuchii TaxID=84275 RepID=A0A9P3C8J1_9PEZI|nr:uncharacterized protein CKM354_000017900 [Cercospora kikuchii]GIZ36711.1 hypothetical protein CKM354_000017900 [Cercospora kikuchii]